MFAGANCCVDVFASAYPGVSLFAATYHVVYVLAATCCLKGGCSFLDVVFTGL